MPARSIMREKPGAVSGAPRSDTNTKGDRVLSRWCRRSSRSSRPCQRMRCRGAVLNSADGLGSFAQNFRRGPHKVQVPQKEQQELTALLLPMEKDIVEK